MTKIKKLIIAVLLLLTGFMVLVFFEATNFSVNRLKVREEHIVDKQIPETANPFKLAYFSDLHYNLFMNQEKLDRLVKKINEQAVDVVLFGGDLISDLEQHPLSSQKQSDLIQALGQINAPLGKFAILGEGDLETEFAKTLASSILTKSNFEILDNQDLVIVDEKENEVLRLFGINQQGNPDTLKQTSTDFENDQYTILLAHKASQLSLVDNSKVDLVLAGHTHGGQINLPFLRDRYVGLEIYSKPTQIKDSTRIDISNGVSQKIKNMRLLADPQISIYSFQNK